MKPASNTAAGTLLITWLASRLVKKELPSSIAESASFTAGMLPMFPAKMKKNTKVSSRQ